MTIRDTLIADIQAFLARHDMAPSRFGELAVNSKGFVQRLIDGKHAPTLTTIDKVYAFMRTFERDLERKKARKVRPKLAATAA
jgi:hypothetical protein